MLGLWIALGVLAALILLIWRLRLGVLASFGAGQVTVDLRDRPFPHRLRPRQKREKSRSKKTGKPGKLKRRRRQKENSPPHGGGSEGGLAGRCGRGQACAGADPAGGPRGAAAGLRHAGRRNRPGRGGGAVWRLCALVWTGMPALEALVEVPDPQIHIGIDFDAPATDWEGELGGFPPDGNADCHWPAPGDPALKWLQTYFKKQESRRNAASAAEHPAA